MSKVAMSATRRSPTCRAVASSPPTRGSSNPSSSRRCCLRHVAQTQAGRRSQRRLDRRAETLHDVAVVAQIDVVVRLLLAARPHPPRRRGPARRTPPFPGLRGSGCRPASHRASRPTPGAPCGRCPRPRPRRPETARASARRRDAGRLLVQRQLRLPLRLTGDGRLLVHRVGDRRVRGASPVHVEVAVEDGDAELGGMLGGDAASGYPAAVRPARQRPWVRAR